MLFRPLDAFLSIFFPSILIDSFFSSEIYERIDVHKSSIVHIRACFQRFDVIYVCRRIHSKSKQAIAESPARALNEKDAREISHSHSANAFGRT